jgi:outer membrane receptor protein involved in Fe transport
MKLKPLASLLALLLIAAPLAYSQSKETGAIIGTALDEENSPLPGVTITLSSPQLMGVRTAVTGADGSFRFPALPPGDYVVTAELPGFTTVRRENVRVSTTVRLTLDFTMKLATIEEEVTVIAESPTVDIKSSETASVSLGDDLLRNIPYSNFAMDILNMAPGVNDDTAYGASDNTGIAWQMDGVDVSDPDGGSAWVFMDPHIIEEAKIMGVGAAAEYGNFTGIIFNLVTKSGGNEFSGHFEGDFQGKLEDKPKGLWGTENNQAYLDDFPGLSSPALELWEIGGHLGGPIKKDKVWFYLGAHYFREKSYVTGFPEAVDYKMPRAFVKINAQLTPSTSIMTFFEYDAYNGINRASGASVSPEACVNQDSPDKVGNFSLTQILTRKTFFDLKAAFFVGYYYLDPEVGLDISAHRNVTPGVTIRRTQSAGWFYYADRARYQANANITHYAEDFIHGNHDFKFGVEFEYGKVRDRYGYTGPNNWYYYDLYGVGPYGYTYNGPYLAFQYEGYDANTRYTRIEEFVQDSWKVTDRLNLNFGIRFSHLRGTVKGVKKAVYSNFRLAPRIGFTYDVLGDKTTILKAHFGQFTEAMLARFHNRLNPDSAYSDKFGWFFVPPPGDNQWHLWYTTVHESLYTMDPDIKHPYMNQFTASIERELFRDASISLTYIYRDWKNIIGPIDNAAIWSPVVITDPENPATTYTVYEQTNPGTHEYVIKNLKEGDPGIGSNTPYRRYWGFEFMFNKRFSDKWQLLASYVYGKAYGTLNNGMSDDIGHGGDVESPNFWINADGNSTNDPTHMLKLQGTYVLPFGVYLTGYFRAITGDAWTRRIRTSRLAHGNVTFFTEPRGSNHYPIEKILDIRLEKTFVLAEKFRLGLMVDVFNVFNDDTITSWGTRIGYDWQLPGDPDYYTSTDGHELNRISRARQARVGIRLMF